MQWNLGVNQVIPLSFAVHFQRECGAPLHHAAAPVELSINFCMQNVLSCHRRLVPAWRVAGPKYSSPICAKPRQLDVEVCFLAITDNYGPPDQTHGPWLHEDDIRRARFQQ